MTFDQIPSSTDVFLDANVLIYHFAADAYRQLRKRHAELKARRATGAELLSTITKAFAGCLLNQHYLHKP